MKKIIISLLFCSIFQLGFSQKKELKTVDKQLKSKEYENALNTLESIKDLIEKSDDKIKSKYFYLKGKAIYQNGEADFEDIKSSASEFKKSKDLNSDFSSKAENFLNEIYSIMIENYNKFYELGDYKNSYLNIEAAYRVYEVDTFNLFNAAIVANQAGLYNNAIELYNELIQMNFKGIQTKYLATNTDTGKTEEFVDDEQRKLFLMSGKYTDSRDSITKSQEINLYRQISSSYKRIKDYKNAISFLDKALSRNISKKESTNLLLDKVNIFVEQEDWDEYEKTVNLVLDIDQENYELLCNLAIINKDKGDTEKATLYINRAIEIDETNPRALIIAGEILFRPADDILSQMNKLAETMRTTKDYDKYDGLKEKRKSVMIKSAGYFESAFNLDNSNEFVLTALYNLFSEIGDDEKANYYESLKKSN